MNFVICVQLFISFRFGEKDTKSPGKNMSDFTLSDIVGDLLTKSKSSDDLDSDLKHSFHLAEIIIIIISF